MNPFGHLHPHLCFPLPAAITLWAPPSLSHSIPLTTYHQYPQRAALPPSLPPSQEAVPGRPKHSLRPTGPPLPPGGLAQQGRCGLVGRCAWPPLHAALAPTHKGHGHQAAPETPTADWHVMQARPGTPGQPCSGGPTTTTTHKEGRGGGGPGDRGEGGGEGRVTEGGGGGRAG